MGDMVAPGEARFLLFAYGSLLPGERDQAVLRGAPHLGQHKTVARYRLVDLGAYPALITSGQHVIIGELFEIDVEILRQADRVKELGRLFCREKIELDTGQLVEAYTMDEVLVRGRRRLRTGDWRRRFELVSSKIPR
jgi:gamma-glutamylcyclotransferase (GGCT)/AIG2-like uncharacterized protein YtfP